MASCSDDISSEKKATMPPGDGPQRAVDLLCRVVGACDVECYVGGGAASSPMPGLPAMMMRSVG